MSLINRRFEAARFLYDDAIALLVHTNDDVHPTPSPHETEELEEAQATAREVKISEAEEVEVPPPVIGVEKDNREKEKEGVGAAALLASNKSPSSVAARELARELARAKAVRLLETAVGLEKGRGWGLAEDAISSLLERVRANKEVVGVENLRSQRRRQSFSSKSRHSSVDSPDSEETARDPSAHNNEEDQKGGQDEAEKKKEDEALNEEAQQGGYDQSRQDPVLDTAFDPAFLRLPQGSFYTGNDSPNGLTAEAEEVEAEREEGATRDDSAGYSWDEL